jgi:hypothetical protein
VSNQAHESEAKHDRRREITEAGDGEDKIAEQEYCKIAFARSIVSRYILVNVSDSSMSNLYNRGSDHECANGAEE